MKKNIFVLAMLLFVGAACDFEIKCLDCTAETITFKTPEEKNKVNEAMGVLNELFDESFEKSNIKEIIPMQDKEGKPLLKILKFKKKGYALISDIKNVDNPAVLFFSKSKFDKDHPGFKVYVSEFKATAARDTLNAILPSSKEFRDKMKKIMKKPKATKKNLKNLPKSYGYGGYGNYGSHNRPTHPASRGIIETFPGDCYDSYGNMKYCSNYCIWEQRTYCGHNSCGAGICYDKKGNLKQKGYYRKRWKVSESKPYIAHQKAPLLKTYWDQKEPYNNTVNKKLSSETIAIGQILAYHRKDNHKYYGALPLNPDWNKISDINLFMGEEKDYVSSSIQSLNRKFIKDGSSTQISDFLYNIERRDLDKYTDIARYLQDSGYDISGKWYERWTGSIIPFFWLEWYYSPDRYDYSNVVHELENNRPVYLSGTNSKGNVHAWVADGYKIYKIKKVYRNEKGYYFYGSKNKSVYDDTFYITDDELIHMNWGLGLDFYYSGGKKNITNQGKKDGWVNYCYWKDANNRYDKMEYNHKKRMITIKPR